ncbi:hypothetical protein TMatcc_003362 [Talaromyces marneffei ATCC 18224]
MSMTINLPAGNLIRRFTLHGNTLRYTNSAVGRAVPHAANVTFGHVSPPAFKFLFISTRRCFRFSLVSADALEDNNNALIDISIIITAINACRISPVDACASRVLSTHYRRD